MQLSHAIVSTVAELSSLHRPWLDLLARSEADQPMLSPSWLLPWWRTFGRLGGRRLAVVTFRDGAGRLVGLAPLLARRHWYAVGVPFRRLELLGSGEPEADEVCSEYIGVIAERGAECDVACELGSALAAGDLGPWDELVLPAMDSQWLLPTALAEELRRRGTRATVEETNVAHYIDLPSTWTAYLASLPPQNRYLITRSLRDFDQWAGTTAELRSAVSLADLTEGKNALVALHRERWGGGGAFASAAFTAFHDAVMPAFHAAGALSLLWMRARGETVAAIYNLRWRQKIYFYQSGRSLALPPGLRPGIVMHAHAIQHAIAAGAREYDFLGGASQYKRQLAPASRSLVSVRVVRPGLRELTRSLASRAAGACRESPVVRRIVAATAGS